MSDRLLKVLNLRRGELRIVGFTMAFRFAMGFMFILTQNVAVTLFLARFHGRLLGFEGVAALPVVYILAAVLSSAFGAVLFLLQRVFSVGRLLAGNVLISAVTLGAFYAAIRGDGSPLLYPAFATVAQVIWVVLTLNIELVTNSIFNVRQGKRVSGLLNGVETVAFIVGAYGGAAAAPLIGVPDLLLWALVALALGYLMCVGMLRTAGGTGRPPEQAEKRRSQASLLSHTRFVVLMVAFITLVQFALFATYIQSRLAINLNYGEVGVATFLGVLQGTIGVVQALLSFFVVHRVVAWVGLFAGASLLPLSLAVTGSAVLLDRGEWLFALIIASNAITRVLQYTFANATTPLIYHCLPERHKLRLQAFLSGVVGPLGALASGVILLALAESLRGGLTELAVISWAVAGSGFLALPVVFWLRREYLSLLLETARAKHLEVSEEDFIDPTAAAFLRERLRSHDPVDVIFAIGTLEKVDPKGLADALPALVRHASGPVRVRALEAMTELARARDLSQVAELIDPEEAPDDETRIAALRALAATLREHSLPRVQHAAESSSPQVRAAALAALARWGGETGIAYTLPLVEGLATSPAAETRQQALAVVREAGSDSLWPAVARLLSDEMPVVRAAAVEVVCRLRLEASYPQVVAALGNPTTIASARRALVELGPDAMPIIRDSLSEHKDLPAVRLALLQVAGRIEHPQAQALLVEAISSPDVRSRQVGATELFDVKNMLLTVGHNDRLELIQRECLYFLDLAHLHLGVSGVAPTPASELLVAAIDAAIEDTLLRVLFQLRLAYSAQVVRTIHAAWRSPSSRHVSLEIFDNILKSPIKEMVLALFDQAPLAERVAALERLLGVDSPERVGLDAALAALCSVRGRYGDWLRVCALHLATHLDLEQRHELAAPWLDAPNPVLREVAAHTSEGIPTTAEGRTVLTTMEKLLFLRKATIFVQVRDEYLAALARTLEEVRFEKGEVLFREKDLGDAMYIIVAGAVDISKEGRVFVTLGPGECVGEMAVLDAEPRSATVTAADDCVMLVIDARELFEIMASEIEIARGLFRVITGRLRVARQELTALQTAKQGA